jgi:hypothetical protein
VILEKDGDSTKLKRGNFIIVNLLQDEGKKEKKNLVPIHILHIGRIHSFYGIFFQIRLLSG